MLQSGALIRDLSVRELIAMVASLYPQPLEVDETLALTGLQETASQRTQKLSGGQTQRVRFAVALVSNPRLLILDEPTVAMDVEGRRSFWETMRELAARGKTIMFATHYLEEADDYADRAVLMAGGRIVADGPPTRIKAMVGVRTIRATLPEAPLEELVEPARASAEPTATGRRSCSAARTPTPPSGRCWSASRRRSDIEIAAAGLEEAFLELTTAESS